jgi:hypothetical protein
MRHTRKLVLVMFAAVLCLAFGTLATAHDEESEQGDRLIERWWQHAASFPNALSPIADESGASCQFGQNGDIWFLHGTFGNVQLCKESTDQVDVRELEVDGKGRNGLIRRRTQPNGFALTLPEDNIFDFPGFDTPAGVYVGVADGYWALLRPLAAGDHTIHIKGGIRGSRP